MKLTLDYPPVWLAGFMGIAWLMSDLYAPWAEGGMRTTSLWLGRVLISAGVILAVWAVVQFRRARTTVIPHADPRALVDTGPYRFSRNPIYLADLMILAGWALVLGAPSALALVLLFPVILERRFIRPEEARLARHLGPAYTDYRARVRRWI